MTSFQDLIWFVRAQISGNVIGSLQKLFQTVNRELDFRIVQNSAKMLLKLKII